MRRHVRTCSASLVALVAAALNAAPAHAEIVFFSTGRSLSVKAHRSDGTSLVLLLRAGGEMVGERRVVTMLFCDVKGSTAAAERLDPEDWTEIMNGAFEQMIRPIYQYEGTVARLMGFATSSHLGAVIRRVTGLCLPDARRLGSRDVVRRFLRNRHSSAT